MRFRKGSEVEVLSLKEAPHGAWQSAEIVSGNGHTYIVRYFCFGFRNEKTLEERVPRKIIRPCPPKIDVDRWEAGELVEVLGNISWKTAKVLKKLSGRYYVVRLLGTAAELTVHKLNLRVRLSWQDEIWVLSEKVSCSVKSSTLTGSDVHQNLKPSVKSSTLTGSDVLRNLKPCLNNQIPQEISVASLKMLKRHSPSNWFESAESCVRSPKKIRLKDEEDYQPQFASSSLQKVDSTALCSESKSGIMRVQASVNNNKTGFRQMVRVRSKRFSECVGTGSSVSNDCYNSDACSVGSCSAISYDESDTSTSSLDGSSQDSDSSSSNAESSKEAFGCREEGRGKHSLTGGGVVRSCRHELYTYRSILGKLYASGPLNWDQEASLTDLRLSLNISTDEHLMEIRNLKSADTQSQFR